MELKITLLIKMNNEFIDLDDITKVFYIANNSLI